MLPEFKAWNKKEKRFVDFENEAYVYDLTSGQIVSLTEDNKLKEEADYIELLQYTGNKNIKTGEKIFEGDVVKTNHGRYGRHIGVVEYAFGSFVSRGTKQYASLNEELDGTFEVIGNRFEHPHLLGTEAG